MEATSLSVIDQSGKWFKYDGESYNGNTALVKFFEENPEEVEKVKAQVHTIKTGEIT